MRPTGIFKRQPREWSKEIDHGYAVLSKADLFDAFVDLYRQMNGADEGLAREALRDAARRTVLLALADGRGASRALRQIAQVDEGSESQIADALAKKIRGSMP